MLKQAKKVIAGVAAAAVLTGSYSYIAHASDGLYHDSNVSITTAVDKYVAENEDAFVIEAPEAKVVEAPVVSATITDATATDAVATGEITEIAPEITGENLDQEAVAEESSSYDFTGKAIVVEAGAVNIRESADVSSKRVGYIFNGGVLDVVEWGEEWTHVSSGDVDGYTMTDFLAFDDDAKAYADANMPGTTDFLGAVAVSDDQTEITAPEETSSEETTSEEAPAQENLEPVPYSGQGQAVVDYACQFLGNPYVWGGTSLTDGCDCSGFTMRVYEHFGYSIPRAGGQQWCGKEVSLSEIQPGDLLFYDHGTGVSQHVALYMGNGQIVHASDYSTGICISNAYYSQPFKAVRVIY